MGLIELPDRSRADTVTDVGTIWKQAIDRYEQITTVKIQSLAGAKNVEEILGNLHDGETKFKGYRHDGSKLDKFRTLVSKSLSPVKKVGDMAATAASTSFPPSVAIFTAVRYLIDSANAVSTDYDKITAFFEDLDLYLHRLKILENWIPHVPELEVALAQVLTSVLTLCGMCVKYMKMKRLVKAFRNLVSGEDDELIKEYAHFHKMVEHEQGAVVKATLAAIGQQKLETSAMHTDVSVVLATTKRTDVNTETLMASTGSMHKRLESRGAALERDEILQGLSSLNFHDKQRDVFEKHHLGTGQWLLETDEFQRWLRGAQNSILWCPGIPGAGKTVMTSIAVNFVGEVAQGRDIAIAYVYCDYKDAKTQSELELLSSITRQLAEQTSPLPPEAKAFLDKNTAKRRNPTHDERISLLTSICLLFETTYVFIDALVNFSYLTDPCIGLANGNFASQDVCPETNRERFLRLITKIEPFVRIFVTSRPSVDLQARFTNIRRLEIRASDADIGAYLKSEIDTNNRLSKFTAKFPELEEEIMRSVIGKATGMFLFAHLQIGRLCRQTSAKMVRENVNALPTGVYATYEDDIKRIEEQPEGDSQLAKRALSYIFCARRPLSVEELRHALAVEDEDTTLDETAFPETETLLNVSAGLIGIDQKSSTIRLVHSTLQEYLEKNGGKLVADPQIELARTCLTYLSFDVFESGPCVNGEALEQRLQTYQFLDYASLNWGHHVVENQLHERMGLALTYLQNEQKLSCFVQVLHRARYRTNKRQDRFPNRFGPLHVSAYWGLDEILTLLVGKSIDVNSEDSYGQTALQIAAKQGHESVVRLLLKNEASINIENRNGETALYWAARNGHKTVVELLLMSGANVLTKDNEGWSALDWAVVGGKSDIVKELLEHGVNAENDGRNEALYLAAGEGHEDTVQILLANGADVNGKDWIGSTALDWAAPGGHESTVRVLLRNGSKLDSRDAYENTALHWAVQHETILQLLLENGADVNAKNNRGQTALCWAARDGPVPVAQLLIKYNADVNIQDKYGCTALHGAALGGREAILQLLLREGADPNAKDKHGWTSLHAAALKLHKGIVQVLLEKVDNGQAILDWLTLQQQDTKKRAFLMDIAEKKAEGSTVLTGLRVAVQERHMSRLQILLEEGADVDAKDIGGWTALILAADNGDKEAVQLLLRNGADINISGGRAWPALHWASKSGKQAVVQLLVENGADINASRNGWTPILLAAKKGQMSIVKSLIENGADVNSEDYRGRRVLHWAARYGDTAMIWLLLDQGASSNVVDRWGRTALIWAIENEQQAVALLLLAIGADVAVKTRDGSTALHLAAFFREKNIVRQLLKGGASVEAETRHGFTALHVAALVGCKAVVQQLLRRGADVEAKARWRGVGDSDDLDDGVADATKVKLLSIMLHPLLFDQRTVPILEAEEQPGLTARQLAGSRGHTTVQRLLGDPCESPRDARSGRTPQIEIM